MTGRARFVQQFPSLSGPHQTEPVPTVQDSLIFRCVTPGPYCRMPAQDASPKVRKSEYLTASSRPEESVGECGDQVHGAPYLGLAKSTLVPARLTVVQSRLTQHTV